MAQENITLTLPQSGQKAVLKSFISHKVNRRIQSLFLGKQTLDPNAIQGKDKNELGQEVLSNMMLTGDDALELTEIIVKGSAVQIGDHYAATEPLSDIIDELDERDFKALSSAAMNVYREFQEKTDPKESKAGNKASIKN